MVMFETCEHGVILACIRVSHILLLEVRFDRRILMGCWFLFNSNVPPKMHKVRSIFV